MEMSGMHQLVELVKRSNIRELTLRCGDERITLKKSPCGALVGTGGELVPYSAPDADGYNSGAHYTPTEAHITGQEIVEPVIAPLVGIFHHVKPLIGPGEHVSAGQVVAVIEAMKLITEVTSPVDGVVVETVIKEGMPAEYGQALFLVKPD